MYEDVKDYMNEYQIFCAKEARKRREIQQAREDQTSMELAMDGMPHGSVRRSLADYAAEIDELEAELAEITAAKFDARRRITWEIERVEDPKEAELLHRKYIAGESWSEIESSMGYSRRAVFYKFKQSLKKIALNCTKLH